MNKLYENKIIGSHFQFCTVLIVLSCSLISSSCQESNTPDNTKFYQFEIVNTYPHDATAFTQGLTFDNGAFYEGTGQYGKSSIRKVEPATGEVLQIHNLDRKFFGEGITILDDKLVQLTWKSKVGFVYDKDSFELLNEFEYPTEGWGITYNGEHLIMSNGTSTLRFLDPETFEEVKQIDVSDNGRQVTNLNELEFIKGEIYANVWRTDNIAIINQDSGGVRSWINLKGILDTSRISSRVDVLNGIAYDSENDRIFVTGKLWPSLFEIKAVPFEFSFGAKSKK